MLSLKTGCHKLAVIRCTRALLNWARASKNSLFFGRARNFVIEARDTSQVFAIRQRLECGLDDLILLQITIGMF